MTNRAVQRALLFTLGAGLGACKDNGPPPPPPPPASVTVTPNQVAITGIGVSQPVTAVALGNRGQALTNATITWQSQNAGIATVTGGATATVTAVAPGSTILTATGRVGDASASATVAVTVTAELRSVSSSLNNVALDFAANRTRQLTASASADPGINVTYTWVSSDPTKFTVTATGNSATLTAVSAGTATLRLTGRSQFDQTRTADIPVTVAGNPVTVFVTPKSAAVSIGQTVALSATVSGDPGVSQEVTWTSSAPTIASVSATGVVTGVAVGTAVITAASKVNTLASDAATVQVTSVRSVTLDSHSVSLTPGTQTTLTATVSGEASFPRTVVWTSKNTAVATVNAGTVIGVAVGSTYVLATATGDASVKDSAQVIIASGPTGIPAVTSWRVVKAPDMPGLAARWFDNPLDVAFAPSTGQLLVIADCGIYGRTTNGFTKSASTFSSCPQFFQSTTTSLYAFAGNGIVYRWTNGVDFVVANPVALPGSFLPNDLWIAPSGVAFAVGSDANGVATYRLSGGAWSPLPVPTSLLLRGVWGISETDVMAVGDGGTVLRFNGATWNPVTGLSAAANAHDVWSSGDGNWYFATSGGAYGLFGSTFRQLHGFSIFRVRASGPNDVWFNANFRWNGQTMSATPVSLTLDNVGFGFSNFAISANDLAVNSLNGIVAYQPRVGAATALILAINPKFTDVDVTSTTHAVAVGDWGQVARFNGTSWQSETAPNHVHLGFVSSLGPTQTWATGASGIFFGNGTTWTEVHRRLAGNFELWGIWANNATDVWAVGRNGLVMRFDGAVWRQVTSGTTTYLRTVWGTSATNVFVGGDNGVILRWNGTSFQPTTTGTTSHIQRIRGLAPNAVYASSSDGVYLRFDGNSWTPLTPGTGPVSGSLWVNDASDIYTAAPDCVYRFNSVSWQQLDCGSGQLFSIDGLIGGSGAVAVGAAGRLWLGRNQQGGFNVIGTTAAAPVSDVNARALFPRSPAQGTLPLPDLDRIRRTTSRPKNR